jgi:N-methylhydantoinase B
VETDIDNGDVSALAARDIYGVVLGDAAATEQLRKEMRARRIEGHPIPVKKLDGKPKMRVTDNLAIYGDHYGCAKCAQDLGPVSHNYKSHCVRRDRPIQASNPIVGEPGRFIDPTPQFRQFCCPGCGLLIENEIAVSDDPLLKDVEILSG